jgi:hypothetical protein
MKGSVIENRVVYENIDHLCLNTDNHGEDNLKEF